MCGVLASTGKAAIHLFEMAPSSVYVGMQRTTFPNHQHASLPEVLNDLALDRGMRLLSLEEKSRFLLPSARANAKQINPTLSRLVVFFFQIGGDFVPANI